MGTFLDLIVRRRAIPRFDVCVDFPMKICFRGNAFVMHGVTLLSPAI